MRHAENQPFGALQEAVVALDLCCPVAIGQGQVAFEVEQKGLGKFIELGCASCHNGYAIGGYSFRKFGLQGNYWEHTRSETIDDGRFAETGEERSWFNPLGADAEAVTEIEAFACDAS